MSERVKVDAVCTKQQARDYFESKGLTYDDITEDDILVLINIAAAIRLCGSEAGTEKCRDECAYFASENARMCIPRMTADAADAITELLSRCASLEETCERANEACAKWKARAERAERALALMWYAYENKDPERPHKYERKAVREAERILGKWEDVMPGMMKECRAWNE